MSDKLKQHYKALLDKYGDAPEAVQYSCRASQEARYEILTQIADLNGCKILDFGCGTGHLASYLKTKGICCEYTGIDIVEDFFPYARDKHPEHRFGFLDDFKEEYFDYAFVSGVFNNKMDDNLKFFQDSVKLLFSRVEKGLAFNLMSSYVDYEDDELWYVDPEEIFAFMKSVTPYVTLRNDYVVKEDCVVPFEFAVYARCAPVHI